MKPESPPLESDELKSLRYALECIAGKCQWIGNPMSDKQIAKYTLWHLYHDEEVQTTESNFPSTYPVLYLKDPEKNKMKGKVEDLQRCGKVMTPQ